MNDDKAKLQRLRMALQLIANGHYMHADELIRIAAQALRDTQEAH